MNVSIFVISAIRSQIQGHVRQPTTEQCRNRAITVCRPKPFALAGSLLYSMGGCQFYSQNLRIFLRGELRQRGLESS